MSVDLVGLELLAQSVAEQLFRDTGHKTGYMVRKDEVGKRALFTFRIGEPYVYSDVSLEALEKAHSWQGIFETLVEQCLRETAPWVLARKRALAKQKDSLPEIVPALDPAGRRHFRLFAETGIYLGA
jgi:hypothetical protein